jgi:putative glutamine amidotransferase
VTESSPQEATPDPPSPDETPSFRRRRWRRFVSMVLGLPAAAVTLLGMWLLSPRPSRDAPRIVVSLDRTWIHRLGISRLTYLAAIRRAGGMPVRLDPGDPETVEADRDAIRRIVAGAHALVISGGDDVDPRLYGEPRHPDRGLDPRRDRLEAALLEAALARGMPVLGICRGSQLLNVARGGSLRDLRNDGELKRRHARYRRHSVRLDEASRLAEVFGTSRLERVVSYHGQAVDRLGDGLRAVGWAEDGVVEAIEAAGDAAAPWIAGVQWHPELSPGSRHQRRLFAALIEAARAYQARAEERRP